MDASDDWDRRRFLALTGGITVLAGCAAEEADDAEEGDDVDDTNEEADDGDDTDDEVDEGDDVETDDDDMTDDSETEDGEEVEGDSEEPDGEGEGEGDDQDETDDEGDDTLDDGETEDEDANGDETDDAGESEDDTDEGRTDSDGNDDTTDEGDDETSDNEPEEPPLSDISIRVVDPEGEPIEGATITGEGESHEADIPLEFDGETGSSGYHHNTIYQNSYTIEIAHSDYESTSIDLTHEDETETTVELEPLAEEPPTSEITIRVSDPEGNPIEGADIVGQGESHPADIPLEFDGETDEDGVLSTPIYENDYTIETSHPDYEPTTIEHTHDGETEVTVEIEEDEPDPDDYENEILNDTPFEVGEIEIGIPEEPIEPRGNDRCHVRVPVSNPNETTAQYDAKFTAYYGEEELAETSVPPRIIGGGGGVGRTPMADFSDEVEECEKITHFKFEIYNHQEVDEEDRDIEGEVTTESAAEGVIEIESHEFEDCMVIVDIVNESDEATRGTVELVMHGDEREHSNSMSDRFDPGETRTHHFGINICAELESYEIQVEVE